MNAEEILKQNLVIEPDLQSFIDFALKSVEELGGSVFAASVALLGVLDKLRLAGAASGHPMTVQLFLQNQQLFAKWSDDGHGWIANFVKQPPAEKVAELREYLSNSVALTDPEILLQRNREMMRHFDESRQRAEQELSALQHNLRQQQQALRETSHLAQTDALTGLLNRRAYDEKLRSAFLHTMRQKSSPLSLVLFDLDHFKEINDEFGHQYGDAYLNKMAVVLREIIREDVDYAFRFGGDEFAAVIFAGHTVACEKAQLVLKLMEGKVSIGITAMDSRTPDSLTLEGFIRRADDALYEAKRRGRGQAVVEVCATQSKGKCKAPCPEMAPSCTA
ncbi:MAG: GGDEF domain-containing protein [Actinomycetota bacterium]|nr:GGDEF domain-containing protein [Actinomycetota bacterium]MDZ4201994.1 GGDEF domain-containing protein [Gallionella sp.]